MPRLRLSLLVLALVALIAPIASAAPAEGRLEVGGALELPDGARLQAPRAEFGWDAETLPGLVITAESVDIRRLGGQHYTQTNPVVGATNVNNGDVNERAAHGASTITLAPGPAAQILVLRAMGDVAAAVEGASTLRPVHAAKFHGVTTDQQVGGCWQGLPEDVDCIDSRGSYELASGALEAIFVGDVQMQMYGPLVTVTEAGNAFEYVSGEKSDTTNPAVTTTEWAVVTLTLRGASVELLADAPASLFVTDPRIEAPSAVLPVATGHIEVGARSYRATSDAVEAVGALVLAPAPVAARDFEGQSGDVLYAATFETDVHGDVANINLDAVPVYQDADAAQAAGALVGLAALTGAAFYFWPALKFHGAVALLPFYTRLSKPDILENDVRNGIYEIIRQNPGISARAVHRMSDQSWGTVVYHLRQLERHHIVVSRTLGRTRNYYENHGKYRGMETQLACLQSDRARVLARIIVEHSGITQETLAEQSGFPQPTTSYYVRKLKRANLVSEAREGRYVRYLPNAELARFLELAESAPDVPPPAAPAAQA